MTDFKKGNKHQSEGKQSLSQPEDGDLFGLAMQNVALLKPSKKVPQLPSQPKARRLKTPETIKPFEQIWDFNLQDAENTQGVSSHESLLFHRKGLRLQDLTRLKKGDFDIEWTLDLHGMTLEAAEPELRHFIDQAWLKKRRFLLIIHGKGYNSETGYPILKNLVNQRLQQFVEVLAFCSARQKDGGTGAAYVFLKAQK